MLSFHERTSSTYDLEVDVNVNVNIDAPIREMVELLHHFALPPPSDETSRNSGHSVPKLRPHLHRTMRFNGKDA